MGERALGASGAGGKPLEQLSSLEPLPRLRRMEELVALQAQLAQVQSAPNLFKLSEPNIVEIVNKLTQTNALHVLYTTNGKEYLTPKQLLHELKDEILAAGGRINSTDLPTILNVDMPHIERAIDAALKQPDANMKVVNGELITSYYLDALADEINTKLIGAGRLTIGDLAVEYTLSADFIRDAVKARLGSIIDATLSGGALFTASYVTRHNARVRGVMNAATSPLSIPAIIRAHGFNEALFHEALRELNESGRLPGTLQPKVSFTPAAHVATQAAAVGAFLKQNGLVEFASLTRMAIRNPIAYLQSEYPGGTALATCYITSHMLSNVDVAVEEACSEGGCGYADLSDYFDFPLSKVDLEELTQASKPIRTALTSRRALSLTPALLVGTQFLDSCMPPVQELATEIAEGKYKSVAITSTSSSGGKNKGVAADDPTASGTSSKGKGKAGKAAMREAAALAALDGVVEDDSDDADGMGGKHRGKQKKKKKNAKKSGRMGDDGEEIEDGESKTSFLVQLENSLTKWRPSLQDTDNLVEALAQHLLPKLENELLSAQERLNEASAGARRRAMLSISESLSSVATNVQLFCRGLKTLDLPAKELEIADRALLRGGCVEWFGLMVQSEALHAGMDEIDISQCATSSDCHSARKQVLAALPATVRDSLLPLEKLLTNKSDGAAATFVEKALATEKLLGSPTPPLDKKREKASLATARASLRQQLQDERQPMVALHLSLTLLELDLYGILLQVPGKLAGALIAHLQPKLNGDAHAKLLDYHVLMMDASGDNERADDARDKLLAALEDVRSLGLNIGKGCMTEKCTMGILKEEVDVTESVESSQSSTAQLPASNKSKTKRTKKALD